MYYSVTEYFCPPPRPLFDHISIDLQRFARRKRRFRLRGAALRRYRSSPKNLRLERGARLVHEGKSVPMAAQQIQRSPSTLRRYLHKTGLAHKTKRGLLTVPRYRATYRLRIFSEGRFIHVHLDRNNAKRAGEYMQAVRQAMDSNDRAYIAAYRKGGVYDVDGNFHVFETRMNILYRLHHEQGPSESMDLEYEVEVA